MKKKTITFIMKGPSIFSELRFAQSQYHTKNNDSSITMGRRITDRFIVSPSSILIISDKSLITLVPASTQKYSINSELRGSVYFGPLKALYFRNVNRVGRENR